MQPSILDGRATIPVPPGLRGYQIGLKLHDDMALLSVSGDLDAAATDALRGMLACIDRLSTVVYVRADKVIGADLDAFDPLFEAARERRKRGLPGVRIESISDAVRDLFGVLRIPTDLPVDLPGS